MVESKTIATVAVAVVLALLGSWLIGVQGPSGPRGADGQDAFGALAGPDIASPYLKWGDVRTWQAQPSLQTATSTLCSIATPSATSTLVTAAIILDSTPHSFIAQIGTSDNTGSILTTLGIGNIGTSIGLVTLVASSTSANSGAQLVVGGGKILNFNLSTSTAVGATFVPTGRCTAVFREL